MEDEAMLLFGEDEEKQNEQVDAEVVEYTVSVSGRLPEIEAPNAESRIIKFPASALSAHSIRCREEESNARLVEWEDGSWTLLVGSEHFRILERNEQVHIFDKQGDVYLSAGSVEKQFNVIPSSLDSNAHRHVVEKSTVARRLNEARKITLAHGLAGTSAVSVSSKFVDVPREKKTQQAALTAEFLEAGMGGIRSIKAEYKAGGRKRAAATQSQYDEDEEDVAFEESESSDDSGASSSDESGSSSSSSSSSSSDSGSSD